MRILHTMDTGGLYGKERMALGLMKKQEAAGHTIGTMGFGNDDFFQEAVKYCDEVCNFKTVSAFYNALKNSSYDVIHSHDYKTGILTAWWRLSRSNSNGDATVIRTVHGYTGMGAPWYSKLHLYEVLDKLMLSFNSANVAVSYDLAKSLGATLIHNGVDRLNYNERPDRNLRNDVMDFCRTNEDTVFCCMARLSPEKNLISLFDAVSKVRNARVVVFGDGPLKGELQRYVDLNPRKYMLAGFDKDAKYYLQFVDVYIQPSLTEGTPISVIEALSQGVPLMLSHVGGMKDFHAAGAAIDCYTDTNMIASTMINFIHSSDESKHQKTMIGTDLYNRKFSADAMYREYNELYEASIASGK